MTTPDTAEQPVRTMTIPEAEYFRILKLVRILTDLDRCRHGRHRGDSCAGFNPQRPVSSGCLGGVSLGNPHLRPGTIIGYDLGGRPYYAPSESTSDPDGWNRR